MAGTSLVRLALVLALVVTLQGAGAVSAQTLETYRGRAPAVFLVTPSTQGPAFAAQMKTLNEAVAGVLARDLIVVEVEAPSEAQLQRLEVPQGGFQVILVGIDGKVIRRWDAPVPAQTLFELIDGAGK
ncbi:DUF4174 domain-containing protein [Xanthobacter sp. DSM 24535]|uniref:DUF4174 domain-containing protein n=1 Tax=Roseixanthobacter psychrophilus TaxID=3119917 RepID=UPI003729CE7A